MKNSYPFQITCRKFVPAIMFLVMSALIFSINISAQKKMKNNDWTNAFPAFPNYRRSVEKPFYEDGKLYFQTAKYRNPNDKTDYFEILLERHPDISAERYAAPNDWIKHLNIGDYRVYQIFPSCGLDFYKYGLQIFPDEMTAVTLKLKNDSKTDLLGLAGKVDFGQISNAMKKRRSI